MFGMGKRTRRVVVAVVYDRDRDRFLLAYNPRWPGYTFPTRPWPAQVVYDPLEERRLCEQTACQALREDLGPTLGEVAEAHWMDRLEVTGVSGRTGQSVRYVYDVVTAQLVHPLPPETPAGRFVYLTAQEILQADPRHPAHVERVLSWTTWTVLARLLEDQQAAVAVVCRQTDGGREYLMTLSRHGRFFFPAKRMGDEVPAERLIVYEFKLDADYTGKIVVEPELVVRMEQQTRHLGQRRYTFHLCRTLFPDEDLNLPGNRLEAALDRAGTVFRWVPEAHVAAPPDYCSDTVRGLSAAVLGMPCLPPDAGSP